MDDEPIKSQEAPNTKDDTSVRKPDSVHESLTLYKELSDHAKTQIDRAWKAYAILAPIIGLIISVGIVIAYFIFGNSLNIVRGQVEKQIQSEFNNENIKRLIQDGATEAATKHIDNEKIKDVINSQVQSIVTNQLDKVNGRIQLLRDENTKALNDLDTLLDLNFALNDAPYEIESLRKVKSITKVGNPKVRTIAERGLNRIIDKIKIGQSTLESELFGYKHYPDILLGLKDTKDWGLSRYIDNYSKIASDQRVVYVYKFLSDDKRDDISKFKFADFVLKTESIPDVIYTTCSFVNRKASIDKDYLFETDQYKKWLKSKI